MPSPLSRRDLLARSTTLAALGATGALAGCTELDVLGGSDPGFRTRLRRWLPAPEAIPGYEPGSIYDGYWFYGADHVGSPPDDDRVADRRTRPARRLLEPLGVSTETLELTIVVGLYPLVVEVEHDVQAVVSRLTDEGFEETGENGDFRLVRGPLEGPPPGGSESRTRTLAMDGDSVVHVPHLDDGIDPRAFLETVLDARRGNAPRYVDSVDGMETVFSEAGGVPRLDGVSFGTLNESDVDVEYGWFPGLDAKVVSREVVDQALRVTERFAFEDADAAASARIDDYAAASAKKDEAKTHRDSSVDGRVAEVVFETPVDELSTPTPN